MYNKNVMHKIELYWNCKIKLSLSACTDDQFTCTNGMCIREVQILYKNNYHLFSFEKRVGSLRVKNIKTFYYAIFT